MLLVGAVCVVAHITCNVSSSEVRGQVAAGVCAADLDAGETVERAVEDQSRQEEGGFERIAYDVSEIAAPAERAFLEDVVRAGGVHEDQNAKLLHFVPERIVLGR